MSVLGISTQGGGGGGGNWLNGIYSMVSQFFYSNNHVSGTKERGKVKVYIF